MIINCKEGQAPIGVILQALIILLPFLIRNAMNIEKFHNELAMRLGYERIVKDKRITISVDETDNPCVTLKVHEQDYLRFRASDNADDLKWQADSEMKNELITILDAVHQAYLKSISDSFD